MAGPLAKVDQHEKYHYQPVSNNQEKTARVLISINMPLLAKMYYTGNSAVDFHNHVCSQDIQIDKTIKTKRWDIRTNLGLLSMLFTDSWLLYRAACGEKLNIMF